MKKKEKIKVLQMNLLNSFIVNNILKEKVKHLQEIINIQKEEIL